MELPQFSSKLALALRALSISRGRLAAELRVDKSVISRWLNGTNTPTELNLANLTTLIATRCGDFTMVDWQGDLAHVSARLGLAPDNPFLAADAARDLADWLPAAVLRDARATTELRGEAYEGFWRTTRPSNELAGRFVHDRILIRRADNGLLAFRLGVVDMRFEGWTFPTQTQLFAFGADPATGIFIFTIFNAVLRHRAEVMDGLSLTCQRNGGGTPVAAAALMERTGQLSGDTAADDAAFEASIDQDALAPEGSIPEAVRARLFRDVGPAALARGGEALLTMAFATSLSRGPLSSVQLAEPSAP